MTTSTNLVACKNLIYDPFSAFPVENSYLHNVAGGWGGEEDGECNHHIIQTQPHRLCLCGRAGGTSKSGQADQSWQNSCLPLMPASNCFEQMQHWSQSWQAVMLAFKKGWRPRRQKNKVGQRGTCSEKLKGTLGSGGAFIHTRMCLSSNIFLCRSSLQIFCYVVLFFKCSDTFSMIYQHFAKVGAQKQSKAKRKSK